MNRIHFATILAVALILPASSITLAYEEEDQRLPPLTPSDTSSFRTTLHSFIDACNEVYVLAESTDAGTELNVRLLPALDRIRDCLDLVALTGDLRDSLGIESAVSLKEVLDRIPLPDDEAIPEPSSSDGVQLQSWRIPGTRIMIQRVEDGPQHGSYLFSADTVRRASTMYGVVKELPYRNDGPKTSPGLRDRYLALTRRQPTLSADTSSPRGTLTLFLDSTQDIFEITRSTKYVNRYDPEYRPLISQIYGCLDLSALPEYTREDYASEAAVCLKEVLDRTTLPSIEAVPGPENIQASEGGDPLVRWQIPTTRISIARVSEGPRQGQYLFTAESVAEIVEMYHRVQGQPYRSSGFPVSPDFYHWYLSSPSEPHVAVIVESLPDFFKSRQLGLAIWQIIGLTLASVAGGGIMLLIYRMGARRSKAADKLSLFRYWFSLVFAIAALIVPLTFKYVAWVYFSVRGTPLYVVNFAADIVFLVAVIVAILALSSRLANSVLAWPGVRSREVDATLIRLLFRVLGIVAAVIVFLEGGRYLGFPVTTLLASAGIGGLAIALSAQGTVKGLFGTVAILLDRPYRVGERIVAKGHDGVVEEIGLRSTKIREFLTNHLISLPNDQMADADIVNIGARNNIYRLCDLQIPIDTSREKLEQALAGIRGVLAKQEDMDPEHPPKVFFNDYNPDSFNIRIIYWHVPPDLWSYYESCERVNLEIFKAFDDNGIQFSLPIRHSFWKTDEVQGPLDVSLVDRPTA
jgi:MscS family membrane protein